MKHLLVIAIVAAANANHSAYSATECKMPNGKIIVLQLSHTCPSGAIGGRDTALDNQAIASPPQLKREGRGRNMSHISQAQFGAGWPFMVKEGILVCEHPMKAVYFSHNKIAYPLNGTAMASVKKYISGDLKTIWRQNPDIPGTNMPITNMAKLAQSLCE